MAESTSIEINGKKQYHCGQYKMKVNTSETKQAMSYITQNCIEKDAVIFTDQALNHDDFADIFESHIEMKSMDKLADFCLHWVNIGIANVKRFLLGIYHVVKEKY